MIVACNYRFHDHESRDYIINTDKLNVSHPFERDLKAALEGSKSKVQLDGEKYQDDWGNWENASTGALVKKIRNSPITIDAQKSIRVYWDC